MKMLMDILFFLKSSFKIFWPVGGTSNNITDGESMKVSMRNTTWLHFILKAAFCLFLSFDSDLKYWMHLKTWMQHSFCENYFHLASLYLQKEATREKVPRSLPLHLSVVHTVSSETSWRSELCASNCVSVYFHKKLKYNWFIKPTNVIY